MTENCYDPTNGSGAGIVAQNVLNSIGYSASGTGNSGITAQNSYGFSCFGSGLGISETGAQSCYGYSATGTGLNAFIASMSSDGNSSGTALSTTHNVNSY